MTIFLAFTVFPSTDSVFSSKNSGDWWYIAIPASFRSRSVAAGTASVKFDLNFCTSFQLILGTDVIPFPFKFSASCTTSVRPTNTFLGSHPLFAHVPPNSLLSAMATLIPASTQSYATLFPAVPVPITNTSNSFMPIL